ncbi:hypothetical protein GCM10010439_27910 [Actinocorallia aurantiaca]|uniref:Uncharacterized protein n=1 Tax=Actinocorallia aurantiaca TaxID=46204 RepID=A0ABP6GLW3_9ACTN
MRAPLDEAVRTWREAWRGHARTPIRDLYRLKPKPAVAHLHRRESDGQHPAEPLIDRRPMLRPRLQVGHLSSEPSTTPLWDGAASDASAV